MTKEQIAQINHSYKHGDYFVFQVGERVFVAEKCYKHRKEACITFQGCQEVDETCFYNGEYYGDTLSETKTISLQDHLADYENQIETIYYEDELIAMF